MNYAIVTTKVEPQTKAEAMAIAKSLGMPLGDVIKALLKQFIEKKTITMDTLDEIPNKKTLAIMKQAEVNYKKGDTSPAFTNIEDELKWLEKQGI